MPQTHWKISLPSSLITGLVFLIFFLMFVVLYLPLIPNLLTGALLIVGICDLVRLSRFYQGLSLVKKVDGTWLLIMPKKEVQVELLPSSFCSAWILLLHLYTPLTNKKIFLVISRDTFASSEWSKLRKALKFNVHFGSSRHNFSKNA